MPKLRATTWGLFAWNVVFLALGVLPFLVEWCGGSSDSMQGTCALGTGLLLGALYVGGLVVWIFGNVILLIVWLVTWPTSTSNDSSRRDKMVIAIAGFGGAVLLLVGASWLTRLEDGLSIAELGLMALGLGLLLFAGRLVRRRRATMATGQHERTTKS